MMNTKTEAIKKVAKVYRPKAKGHSRKWYELNGLLPKKNNLITIMEKEFYVGKHVDGEWTVVRDLGKHELVSISQRDSLDQKINIVYLSRQELAEIVEKVNEEVVV